MFLDPKFFDDKNRLHPSVRQVLLDVANDVLADLKEKVSIEPVFIILTGSMTGLNWDDESDLDLHIGIDFSAFPEDEVGLYKNLLSYYARNFNANKYTLKGRNIELYFQDTKEKHESPGIYDLVHDMWVKTPDQTMAHFNSRVKEVASNYLREVSILLFEWEEVPRNRVDVKKFLDKVNAYMKGVVEMRKQSLLTDGMNGFGNQVFRELRRNGTLPKLANLRKEVTDAYYEAYEWRKLMSKSSKVLKLMEKEQYSPKVDEIVYSKMTDGFNEDDWIALGIAALDQAGLPYKEVDDFISRIRK